MNLQKYGSRARIEALELQVAELQDEVQEARQLNRRVAELLDIVEELLVPVAQQDTARVEAYLASHRAAL